MLEELPLDMQGTAKTHATERWTRSQFLNLLNTLTSDVKHCYIPV